MADKLTPQQAQAVYNRGGNLLVSAAAGSGKTKVLVDRLLTYLTDPNDPANLDEFLIITYTKAAASELRGKIASKLSERIAQEPENKHLQKQMQRLFLTKISTVHGFCSDLLREYSYRLDIAADFRVADENECREIRETVMSNLLDRAYVDPDDTEDFKAFVDSQGLGRDDRLVPEIIEKVFDSSRCHLDPQGWIQKCLHSVELEGITDVSQTIWGDYLICDLREYLDDQIKVLKQCLKAMDAVDGMTKPVDNIRATIQQLVFLRNAGQWDEIVRNRNIDYGRLVFPKKNVDAELCEQIKAARNACKKGLERKLKCFADTSSQVLTDLDQTSAAIRGLTALVMQFERDYSSAKNSRRVLDFGDLEHKTLDLLLGKNRTGPTAVAREVGRRYLEVMVDEYQDSNGVQDAIFGALTQERQNCFLVGDVKQSIYQFRLADPTIFLKKYHDYNPAEDAQEAQGRKVLLSHNFRSGPEVVSAANDVFHTCMSPKVGGLYYTDAEALREGVPHKKLPDAGVELYALEIESATYPEEASFVAEKIDTMLRDGTLIRDGEQWRTVQPEDIVILLRSPGSAGEYFYKALEAKGIRCCSGGGSNLLQTEEVETLRSFLQTIMNPRQDIPLVSTLCSPLFAFTANELAGIRAGQKKGFVYDVLLQSDEPKARRFIDVLRELRDVAKMNTLTELLHQCFLLTKMDSIYASMQDGETKRMNLQMFYQLAVDFEKGNLRDLPQFLDHLEALEKKGLAAPEQTGMGCVRIMSIHKSKGLEFPVVFLCNLSRKFNQESMRAAILCDRELGIGLSVADTKKRVRYPSVAKHAIASKMTAQSVSEEMRVLYVAMTRARDRLIMTYASQHLESDLQDAALRQSMGNCELLCQDAICLGDWILIAAMRRTEAGQLHALAGKPRDTHISDYPWKIVVTGAPCTTGSEAVLTEVLPSIPREVEEELRNALAFRYPYHMATQTPSKQTATDRKGRYKDAEAAENAQEPRTLQRSWRKPSFASKEIEGKTYGSLIHAAMQYVDYKNCGSRDDVEQEIQRIVTQGFLTEAEGKLINCEWIANFFATEIGRKLRTDTRYLREFKFSVLDDGRNYDRELEGEAVLLQGVVDCAFVEEDGITVLDFKTDYVTEDTIMDVAERYRAQILTYGEALSRIYEMPVKKQYLYFFRLNRFVEV